MDITREFAAVSTTTTTVRPKKKRNRRGLLKGLVYANAVVIGALMVWLVGYLLWTGVPAIKASLFAITYTSENVSLLPALINTLTFVGLTLALACPIGVFAAIYFVEYAVAESHFVKMLRVATETLAGVPSIVFGLFGYLCFVVTLKLGYSVLAGSLTLAMMVLPVIIRTAEEALLAVPASYREGSYALGAGKVRTIFKVVLPVAGPGITSGIILSIGRIVGETAALIYTAGTLAEVAAPLSSGRTLSVHMYALMSEGLHVKEAQGTAVILLLIVISLNLCTTLFTKKFQKEHRG